MNKLYLKGAEYDMAKEQIDYVARQRSDEFSNVFMNLFDPNDWISRKFLPERIPLINKYLGGEYIKKVPFSFEIKKDACLGQRFINSFSNPSTESQRKVYDEFCRMRDFFSKLWYGRNGQNSAFSLSYDAARFFNGLRDFLHYYMATNTFKVVDDNNPEDESDFIRPFNHIQGYLVGKDTYEIPIGTGKLRVSLDMKFSRFLTNLFKAFEANEEFKELMPSATINEDGYIEERNNSQLEYINANFHMMKIGYENFVRTFISDFLTDSKMNNVNLCVSMHPLDYLTMSDNGGNWSSCYSLQNDGCYKTSLFELMDAPNNAIVYIEKDGKKMDIGNNKWNSKIFRTTLVFDEDVAVLNKSYPFISHEMNKAILEHLSEMFFVDKEYELKEIGELGNLELEFTTEGHLYNDFNESSYFPNHGIFSKQFLAEIAEAGHEVSHEICFAGQTHCPICGTNLHSTGDESDTSVFCYRCKKNH